MIDVAGTATPDPYSLIVHSHLRWDFVWQRPQQILSRFGRSHPVVFVEEPVFADDILVASLDVTTPCSSVHRVVPQLPAGLHSSYDNAATLVRSLLLQLLIGRGELLGTFGNAVQWFHTPMPAPVMIGAFGERGIVYDCMDELAHFRYAPSDLAQRELFLLSRADIVFTGGQQLYESKSRHHENVHFLRLDAGLGLVRAATWECIVEAMEGLILRSVRGLHYPQVEPRVGARGRRSASIGGATRSDRPGDDEAIVA